MRRLLLLLVLVPLTACTPAQVRAWLGWHRDDPEAAVAFLSTDEGQALLAERPAHVDVTPGDCSSYRPLFVKYGLPVATFERIAWRESGCDHTSYVIDSDDAGGGLLGINLKGYTLATGYYRWCGVTLASVTDAETNVRCAAEAFERMGLAPWRT